MSAADIELLSQKRDRLRAEFKTLVPLKKTPEVFARRQKLKQRISTFTRWLIELNAKQCTR
jgi:hypothetical protein